MTWQSLANQVGEGITGGGAGATVEAVEGADGTTFDVPDTPENTQRIGRPGSDRVAAQGDLASFPQARVVAVAECGTHAIVAATVGPITKAEAILSRELLPGRRKGELLIADRGFARLS